MAQPTSPACSGRLALNIGLLVLDHFEPADEFLAYARNNPAIMFKVTAIRSGLAGYRHVDMAPMFAEAPVNCRLPDEWRKLLRRPQP